jgi:hypothetical protein
MREIAAWGLFGLLGVGLGGCFEEPTPVEDSGAMQSTGEVCIPGTESCPCIQGACVGDLECLSSVCVDAGSTSAATGAPETATSTSGPSTTVATTLDEGPTDEGPMTSDASGGLPPGAQCDPFVDLCDPGLACNGVDMAGLVCTDPGFGGQGSSCEEIFCDAGFLCTYKISTCMSEYCCAAICNLVGRTECPEGLTCRPFFPDGSAPLGYDHVGVCDS